MTEKFAAEIAQGYAFPEPTAVLGAAMLDGSVVPEARVKAPLAMLDRHGLVAGLDPQQASQAPGAATRAHAWLPVRGPAAARRSCSQRSFARSWNPCPPS